MTESSATFEKIFMMTSEFFKGLFMSRPNHYDGVARINVYLLRVVFTLTFVFVGMGSWTTVLNYQADWTPFEGVAWSVWAAYSALAMFGILKPWKMLPVMAFQIFYKMIWLTVIAYPLWKENKLAGSGFENMTKDFLWVVLPIVAMPWKHFFKMFLRKSTTNAAQPSFVN